MTIDQWRRISAVFAAAEGLTPSARAAYLDQALAAHPEDRPEIESLLAQHEGPGEPAAAGSGTPEPFHIGQQVGHYRVLRRLKPGGMGVLYVAEDNLGREVVLKVLAPALATDPSQRARLRQEAEAMARLQHPGIAAVFAFEEQQGMPVLVSELIRGRDLRERLEDEGPYERGPLLALAVGIADALSAAHRAGIVHRDLKPENIMLPEGGGVKLVDFGIARIESPEGPTRPGLTGTGALIGTPGYMAPEQLLGSTLDARADIFALGVVLYEAATGVHPFAGRTRATTMANILQKEPLPLSARRSAGFGPLEVIVARCLQKDPARRYATVAELAADLRRAERGASVTAAPEWPPPTGRDPFWWWRFHQLAVSIVYGLLLLPQWLVRERLAPGASRDLLFYGALGVAVVSILVRLNAAFLAHAAPAALGSARPRARVAALATDGLLAGLIAVAALMVRETRPGLAALLLSAALGVLVTLVVIEPATARAAFSGDAPDQVRR